MIAIRPARFPEDCLLTRSLFREYAAGLGVDLCFQDFDAELADLPGKYAPPQGALMLAWQGDEVVGCVALRPIDQTRCEMKRLYVKPSCRTRHLGRRLVERICEEARRIGYREICLDTLPTLESAKRLYLSMGFQPIAPYVFNPIEGTVYLGLAL